MKDTILKEKIDKIIRLDQDACRSCVASYPELCGRHQKVKADIESLISEAINTAVNEARRKFYDTWKDHLQKKLEEKLQDQLESIIKKLKKIEHVRLDCPCGCGRTTLVVDSKGYDDLVSKIKSKGTSV